MSDDRGSGRRGFLTGLVVGVSAAAMLAGGVAVAAIPATGTGVINACRNKTTGALRVIDTQRRQRCTSREKALAWNAKGATGARGPQGVRGVPGAAGPQGPPGPATGAAGGALAGSYPNPGLAAAEPAHLVGGPGEPAFVETDAHLPTLTSLRLGFHGWASLAQGFSPVTFRKDQLGVVHLGGVVCPKVLYLTSDTAACDTLSVGTSGGIYLTLFTLPAGYRPAERTVFSIDDSTRFGRADVLPDGRVQFLWTDGIGHSYIALDGISFVPAG